MKSNILKATFLILMCTTLAIATSCNFSTDSKVETSDTVPANVEDTNINLNRTLTDSIEFKNYKSDAEIKLRENELLIADMKDKMTTESKEFRIKYEKQLDSLNMQNSLLRNNMRIYIPEGTANWELFKKSFNKELDALSKSIAQITESNAVKG